MASERDELEAKILRYRRLVRELLDPVIAARLNAYVEELEQQLRNIK